MSRPFQRDDTGPTRGLTVQLVSELYQAISDEARSRDVAKHAIHKALIGLALETLKTDPTALDRHMGRY